LNPASVCITNGTPSAHMDRHAKRLGVDIDQLLISQPDTGEQALEIVETLVRSGALDIVVVDSVFTNWDPSTASQMASAANGGGTKIIVALA
jgi:RecA/RadA recombinase